MTEQEGPGGVEVAEAPTPILAGTFAIYEAPGGSMVLITETTEHGRIEKQIPAGIVKLAAGRFGQFFGGGKRGMDQHSAG